jgi:hypothetical protein
VHEELEQSLQALCRSAFLLVRVDSRRLHFVRALVLSEAVLAIDSLSGASGYTVSSRTMRERLKPELQVRATGVQEELEQSLQALRRRVVSSHP